MAIEQYNWDEAWRRVTGQPHPSSRTTNSDTDPIDWDKARYHAQIFDHNAAAGQRTQEQRQYIQARKQATQVQQSPRTQAKLKATIDALHEGERKNVQRTPPKTQTSQQIQQAVTPTKTQTQEVAAPRDQRNPEGAESALAPENSKRAMAEQLRALTQQNIVPAVDYASIPGQADYPTLSQYQSTEHGNGQVSAWTGAYGDTGFDDITYDIINRNPTAQLRGTTQNVFAGGALQSAERAYLTQLTDAEIGIFNYLYAQDTAAGDDTHYRAYRYIKDIKPQLTARARQESAATWQAQAQQDPVGTSIFSIGLAPFKGVGYVGQALDLLDDDKIDPNAGYNLFANVSGDIRGTVSQMAEDKWGKPGSFAYNTALSMADFLATTLVSGSFSGDAAMANLGKKLALGIMSSGAAADATTAAKERGLNDQDAFALGTVAGAAEILTEKYSLDALLDPQWSSGALKYVTRNALVEGSEEVGSDLINTVADLLIAGNKSEIHQAVQAYKKQGRSEEEAFGLTMADMEAALLSGNRNEFNRALNRYLEQGYDYSVAYWMAMADQAAALGADYGEINRAIQGGSATPTYNPGATAQDDNEEGVSDAEALGLALRDKALSLGADFLGGALSGAIMSGARVAAGRAMSDVDLRQSGKTLRERDANAAELLVHKAQEADAGSDVYKNAAALQQKLDSGGKISDYEIGKLFSDLTAYVQENGPLDGAANAAAQDTAQPEAQPTLALPRGDEVQPAQPAPETAPVDSGSAQSASAAEIQPQAGETRDGNQTPAQSEQASAPENAAQEPTIYPPAVQQAWNILQDLQDADELTDAQQQMVDAAYATLNEFFAENDTQPEAMAPAERTEPNGQQEQQPDILHLRGQQRVSAADDAGAVRPLEAGGEPPAGRTFDGRDGNRRQPRLANDRLREAQNRGLMPGSTRELGWADGTNEPRVILYPEDAWDEELQSVATQWRGQGYQVQFVIGPLEFQRDGYEQLADSVVQGNQIAIRANSIRWSAQQLSEHEGVHVWGGQHAQQRAAMLAELQDTLRDAGEPGMQMWSRYAEAYGEAYNGDQDALLEEIAADVWAGINRVGRYADDAVVDQLLQVVERYVGGNTPAAMQQMAGDTAPARGLELDRSNPTRAGPGEQSLAPGNPELTGETDSQGRQITQAQSMYFTESEVRDGLFNLLAVYPTKGYRSELGQWFSAGKTGSNAYYLNITNPYYTTRADLEDALAGHGDAAAYVVQRKSEGYDGMMISDGDEDSYVTFYPQQAKRTSDKNPVESEPRYSLSRTTDNKPFVEVEQDILAGVPEKDWASTVRNNLKDKFPDGIPLWNNEIRIDKQSQGEMTSSGYTKWLRYNDPQTRADKLRATNNADEILHATTDWVNEGLNHSRKDKIEDFARGEVLLRVGGNDYTAEVLVGKRKNGSMVMYDVLNLQPTTFTEKETNAVTTTNPSPGTDRNTAFISDASVASSAASVKPEFSGETDSQGRELSQGQATYFENSEVRDRQYNLLPVYHATDNRFTIFDRDKLGSNTLGNATDWGMAATSLVGHWFSDHDVSGQMLSERSDEYYLNITNPYQTSLDALADELRSYAEDDAAVQDAFDMGDYAPTRAAAQAYVEQLQSDGYDGLMLYDTEFGGRSYVVFDSQQAKLTNNRNPSDNPDVRYSLAGDTADGLDLSQTKRRLVNRTMNHAAKELRGLINADTRAARAVQQSQLAALGRDILQKGSVPQSQIIDAFETIWAAGRQVDTTARDDAADIRDYLRRTGVSLAAQYRADVNGGDWNGFRRQNFGRLKITTEGLPVDQAYAELSGQRPDLFPADIANPADQIQRMAEVAEQLRPQERDMDALYGSAAKGQIEAAFIDMVEQMQQAFNPRERTFTAPAEWGDAEAEEADALWRLDVEADGQPVQDTMEGFQQPVQAAPVRLDSRAMGEEDLAQQVRQTAAKYGQEGKLTPRDPDEAYHLDWVELMNREGDENQSQLEQRRTRWKGEAQKMQAAGASREEILMRTGWYQTPEGEWRDFEQPRYNQTAEQVQPDAMAEQIQNEYLRNLTRDAFRGSKSLENLGVKIAGSVGNYTQVDQLIANDRAARRVTRDVRKAEKRLRPNPTEVQLARSMADGLLTWDDLPRRKDVDKNAVAELADYYQIEKSLAMDLLEERKREMFADVDYAVEQLMRDHDAVHLSAAPIMHWRTPRRNLIRMFGRAQGQRMIDYLITPTAANEAERYRWTNKQYDMVREFEGEDGEKRALNRPERAATQLMLEGQAIEEQAAQLEERVPVYNATEMLQAGKDAADVKREFGLNYELMEIAERLSQWRQAQADILANPEIDNQRVAAATQVLRERYASYYDAINDFLAAHGYKPIGFIKGYAPHLQPEAQRKGLQKVLDGLGLGDQVTRLPANIAGLTQQFRPNKRWDPHFLNRMGDKTKLDAIEGFEVYVDYLSDIFYHMDDTIRTRRMSNYFRRAAAADDIHAQISQAEDMWRATTAERAAFLQQAGALPDGAALSKASTGAALQDYISKMYESLGETGMYSDFVNWLEDYANQLTAKQYVGDRGFETVFGRETLNLANKITNAFQRSQVAGNISSVLNQGAQSAIIVQACGPRNTMQALYDIANGKLQRDNFVDRSDFLTGKAGINRLIVDPTEKALHLLFTPAEAADTFVSTVATRAAYIQAVRDGMSDAEAMRAADLKAEQIMGSRMKGSRPQAFRSKNIFFRILNMFQLESLNTFEYYEQDTILQGFRDINALKDKKGKYAAIAKLVSTLGQLLVSAFVVNRLAEEIYGGTPAAFDLIGYAASFLGAGRGLTTNEEIKRWLNATWRRVFGGDDLYEDVEPRKDSFDWGGAASGLGEEIGSDLPMVRNIMGMMGLGDQSMPIPDVSTVKTAWETARESGLSWDTGRDISSAVAQLVPGGRQLSKSFNGLEVMLRGGKWRGDRLLYPVEDEIGNWLQALLFGPNGLVEQRGYYVGGAEGLSASETETYKALTEAGMSQTEAYNQMLDTHDLAPEEGYQSVRQIQKWEMLVDAGLSDSYLYAAVATSMSDDQRAKLDTALDSGVEMPVYVAWRRQMLVDGGKTQEAMEDWLDTQRGLSNDAKATLWQLTNANWKPDKNPYSVQVGEDIYAVYGPQN